MDGFREAIACRSQSPDINYKDGPQHFMSRQVCLVTYSSEYLIMLVYGLAWIGTCCIHIVFSSLPSLSHIVFQANRCEISIVYKCLIYITSLIPHSDM